MRDHLLGCTQFIPDVENERVMPLAKAKPFALGVPTRVYAEEYASFQKESTRAIALDEFEDCDYTPAAMRDDFPREYDLTTMLNEAAGRCDALGPFFDPCDLTLEGAIDCIRKLAEEVCGINDMVLNANKSTLKVDTYPTSAEIKDFYKRAALSKVEDWERMVFEARLALGKPTAPK